MDKNKEAMFKAIASDFKKAVKEYRAARRDEELEEDYIKCIERRGSQYTSKDFVKMTRVEYWIDIIKSKIEVIAAIGGFDMMQEFSYYLSDVDSGELMLESAFSYLADGICGWCS